MRSLQQKFYKHNSYTMINNEDDGGNDCGSGGEALPGLVALLFDNSVGGLVDLFFDSLVVEKYLIFQNVFSYIWSLWNTEEQ